MVKSMRWPSQTILRRLSNIAAVVVAAGMLSCSDGSKKLEVVEFQVLVDQFGYRPQDPKVAVVIGSLNGGQPYELRNVETEQVVDVITPEQWAGVSVHSQSGGRAWWVDF